MPVYRFRLVPHDSVEDVEVGYAEDDVALAAAKEIFRAVLLDAASKGRSTSNDLEVVRDDGSLVGLITPGQE